MKKLICVCLLAALCLTVLAGCQCEHEFADASCEAPKTCTKCAQTEGEALGHTWTDADCQTPKTCSVCAATEGEALGHTWTDADCLTPKTCSVCSATEGEALGHTWTDATCAAPKTCSVCAATEGEALEHTWTDATTEAPKTCSVCAATEGERIITDERFTTSACAGLFGTWRTTVEQPAYALEISDSDELIVSYVEMTFGNDGTCSQLNTFEDPEKVESLFLAYVVDLMYAQFELEGMSREEADAGMIMAYGMTMEDYCKALVAASGITEGVAYEVVYYVDGNALYVGESWDSAMAQLQLALDGDTLTLTYEDGTVEVYTRVTE